MRRVFASIAGVSALVLFAQPLRVHAQKTPNGMHAFDWDIGTWKTHQRRLMHPLTGSSTWVEYHGTDAVQKIWDGANMGKIEADGPAGHLEIYTLRMYDKDSGKWYIYFGNPSSGSLSTPVVGAFTGTGAEFYDNESYRGKPIRVRFRISNITATSCSFDQSFSPDDGKTWETNFIVDETLLSK